jgi:hypothetical protein
MSESSIPSGDLFFIRSHARQAAVSSTVKGGNSLPILQPCMCTAAFHKRNPDRARAGRVRNHPLRARRCPYTPPAKSAR